MKMMKWLVFKIFIISNFLSFYYVQACPFCHTTTADEVKVKIKETAKEGIVLYGIIAPFFVLMSIPSLLSILFNEKGKNYEK